MEDSEVSRLRRYRTEQYGLVTILRYPLIASALRSSGFEVPPDAMPPSRPLRRPSLPKRVQSRQPEPRQSRYSIPAEAARFISAAKKGRSRKRVMLWYRQGGLCHWCSAPTVLLEPRDKAKLPPNAATIDHLRSRLDPSRTEPCKPGERRLVMACNRCNSTRGKKDQETLGVRLSKQEEWLRSGNFFSIAKRSGALNEVDGIENRRGA